MRANKQEAKRERQELRKLKKAENLTRREVRELKRWGVVYLANGWTIINI